MRTDSMFRRLAALEERKEMTERPLVLASGLSINIGSGDLARLFREIDGKTRGIPSQQGDRETQNPRHRQPHY